MMSFLLDILSPSFQQSRPIDLHLNLLGLQYMRGRMLGNELKNLTMEQSLLISGTGMPQSTYSFTPHPEATILPVCPDYIRDST